MIDDGNRKHDKYSSSFTKNELHGHTPMCGHMGTSGVQPKDIIIFLYTFYTFRKTLNHFRLFPPSFLLHVPGLLFSSLRFSGKTTHTHTTFKKKSWDFAAAASSKASLMVDVPSGDKKKQPQPQTKTALKTMTTTTSLVGAKNTMGQTKQWQTLESIAL